MTVDIRGTNTHNKGAELMLRAAAERLRPHFAISALPAGTAYEVRAALGLRQTLHLHASPRLASRAGGLVPGRMRDWYGLVADDDITGVVDAAGFAYGDQFAPVRSRREALRARRWRARGVPHVFLPQAFGPFREFEQRRWCTELLGGADLIFCRDRMSYDHVRSLGHAHEVLLAPDFTIGLQATPPNGHVPVKDFVALVPNLNLVARGGVSETVYARGLQEAGAAGRAHGLEPVVVLHEGMDRAFGGRVAGALDCPLVADEDPLVLKGVLGSAQAVVGSRFHAVVGALAQGVPTVTIGWSHKYGELLQDFGVADWLTTTDDDLPAALSRVLADAPGRARLVERRGALLEQVDDMWARTIEVLAS